MADQEIGALKISLSLQEADFSKSMSEITRKVRGINSEFKVASAGVDGFDKTLAGMQANSRRLTGILELQQSRVSSLKAEYDRASSAANVNQKEVDNLAKRYNNSVAAMKNTESQLYQVNKQIAEQSTSWGRLAAKADKFRETGDRVSATGQTMMRSFGVATAAVGGGLGLAAKSAMDFESQMSGVKSVMAPDEVRKYSKELENLAIVQGSKTAFSATQAAQAEEELVKAGVSVRDIIHGGLSGALNLATAGSLNLKDAAEIASTALNSFKKDGLSVAQAADILAGAANASATDVGEMKFGLSAVSAVAAGVGLSFKDTATALAVFAQNGLRGQDAGTSLKTMLSNLHPMTNTAAAQFERLGLMTFDASKAVDVLREHGIKPLSNDQGKLMDQLSQLSVKMSGAKEGSQKQEKAFRDLTMSSGAVHSAFYKQNGQLKDMADIAKILQSHMKDLNGEQRQTALYTMFGSDAIRGANILFREGAKGVDAMAASMSKITAADVARQKLNNMKGTLEQLRGSLETAGITVGTALLPTLRDLTKNVQGLVDWFNKLDPATQQWIAKAALGTTATLGVGTAMGAMTMAIGGGIKSFGSLAVGVNSVLKVLGEVKAAKAAESMADLGTGAASAAGNVGKLSKGAGLLTGALGLVTNPVGATVLGLGALGLGAYAVYKHMNALEDTSLAAADAIGQQHDVIASLISQYDSLRSRSILTTDQFARFVDIQSQLKKATSADEIKRLKDESDRLQQKSGLSNKELTEMVSLNHQLVKAVPGATDKITEQGNAIAKNTDKAKQYNEQQLNQQVNEMISKRSAALSNISKLHDRINDSQKKINANRSEENRLQEMASYLEEHGEAAAQRKYKTTIGQNQLLLNGGQKLYDQLSTMQKQDVESQKQIAHDKEQLTLANRINDKIASTYLKTVGITDTGQKGVSVLANQVHNLEDQRAELDQVHDRLTKSGKANATINAQYLEGRQHIQDQIDKLTGVGSKINKATNGALDLNKELGKNINKNVDSHTHTDGTYKGLDNDVSKNVNVKVHKPKDFYDLPDPVSKIVNLDLRIPGNAQINMYRALTGHAAGAKNLPHDEVALVGEAGREFVHDPKIGTYLADGPSIVHLSAGSSVLKNADTERLGKALGLKGFAVGVGDYFDRISSAINNRYVPDISQTAAAPQVTVNNDNSALLSALTKQLSASAQQINQLQKVNDLLTQLLDKTFLAQVNISEVMDAAGFYKRRRM